MQLNREQARAVRHTDGHLLVTAGPGTGKTFVIENKVLHLALEEDVKPQRVLCLTFTDKAAGELRERVGRALAREKVAGEVQASTFHGFCQSLLGEFAGRAGLPPHFHLLNGAPLEYLLLQHLAKFDIRHTELLDGGIQFVGELLWLRQRCLQERIAPEAAFEEARRRHAAEMDPDERAAWGEVLDLAAGLAVVDTVLAETGAVTYEDLIAKALALVEGDAIVRSALARRFDHLLVDEFQDNNYAQAQLVHALAGLGLTVTVVGDEDQSIYKFRGAYERTLKDFLDAFEKDAGRVDLVQNYRSTPLVLEAAEVLVRHAAERLDKPALVAARDDLPDAPARVRVVEAEYPDDEARAIAAECERLHREDGVAYGDMAILYRGANVPTMKVLPQALDELGIPREIATSGDLFARPEVKDLVSWLLVLRSPDEPGPALHRVLVSPEVGLPLTDEPTVTRAVRYGRHRGVGALRDDEVQASLSPEGARAVRWLLAVGDRLVEARRSSQPSAYVGLVLRATGLLARHTRDADGSARTTGLSAARSLVHLVQIAREWERAHPLSTVDDFADYLSFLVRRGSDLEEATDGDLGDDAVHILTVHKSKGKEFPVVFVVGLNEGQFPPRDKRARLAERLVAAHRRRPPPTGLDVEEERRLLFVAMTRARDRLVLTRHHRTTPSARGVKKPSRFLAELGLPDEPAEQGASMPDYLSFTRVEAGGGADERPLSVDEGLWLTNRVAAEVHALTQAQRRDEDVGEGVRRIVEAALRAVRHARPDTDVDALAEALAPTLGPIDAHHRAHADAVGDLVAARSAERVFSYSAFRAYETCPKQYYYRYILGVPEPATRALERGTIVHRVLERFHAERDGEGTLDDLLALLEEEIGHRFAHSHAKEAEDTRAELAGLLEAYWNDRASFEGTTETVEHSLNVAFEDFQLRAKVDRVDRLPDGRVELVDYKTGKAGSPNSYATKDLQLPLYVLAWREASGEPPAYATVWGLKNERIVRLDTDADLAEDRLADAYARAKTIVDSIDAGRFEATPGWDCRMCPFSFICNDSEA